MQPLTLEIPTVQTLSPRTGSPGAVIARGDLPADTGRHLPAEFPDLRAGVVDAGADVRGNGARARSPVCGGMVLEESSSPGYVVDPHETPQQPVEHTPSVVSRALAQPFVSEAQANRYADRLRIWRSWLELKAQGRSKQEAEKILGVSDSKLTRMEQRVAEHGEGGLADGYHRSGRRAELSLTDDESHRLSSLYLQTNRTKDAGSMQTACKYFALDPQTREEIRCAIMWDVERGRVPRFCKRVLEKITAVHFGGRRKPKMLATQHLAGSVGAFARDKIERRRVVESDDGTLNFAAWINWPQGGDPCSDRYGVRLGRWQILPAKEAGWSNYYLGYALVARPRGSYTQEDVRSVISMVVHQYGLPDAFRFERGTWESNSVVDLLKRLGVELDTVHQSNQKPYIEGGFSKMWTDLSLIEGQVGRYRGEMETEGKLVQKCQTGRCDPRQHFHSLEQSIKAIDGALAMHNSDTVISDIYGKWVPEVRHKQLAEERPWQQIPPDMDFLFAPWVKEWTVAKGTVGNKVQILPDVDAPVYFSHEELWRWNGRKVRVYFDPTVEKCVGTIVALEAFAGYSVGDIICRADLFGELPHFARAAVGWASGTCPKPHASHRGPLSAVRREVRALAPGGRIQAASSEVRDGAGNGLKAEVGRPRQATELSQSTHRSEQSRVQARAESMPVASLVDDEDFQALS